MNTMKKMFTLVAGLLMTALVFAADRRPTVTVKSQKNFRIVIDGKSFFGNSTTIRLDDYMSNDGRYGNSDGRYGNNAGRHTIQVFEMQKVGFFGRRQVERMVSSTAFRVNRNDVLINIDYFGNINVREMRSRFDQGRDWNDRDGRDRDHDWNDNNRGY